MKLHRLFAIAALFAAACVEFDDRSGAAALATDDETALSEEGEAAPPPPPPPPPMCNNGSTPGGQMKGVGWTCEINPAGSNLCCDSNLGLFCKVVPGRPPYNAECDLVGPPPPGPPMPGPTPVAEAL